MKTKLVLSVLTVIWSCLFSGSFLAFSGADPSGEAGKESILKAYGKVPLYFIENKGQLDPKVRFYVKTSGQTLYFTDEGIVFDLLRREKEAGKRSEGVEKGRQATIAKKERLVFNLRFENAREGVLIEGLDRQDAGINYFVGNDRSKWKTGIPTYKGVVYKEVYRGIDLKVFGKGKDIEYEFLVNPGANPDDILLTYNGIEGLATNGEGELLIATAFGELKETKPYIYQEIGGKRVMDGNFEIRSPAGQSQTGKFSYGFQVASYDPSYPVIIDPTLSYSTYLGGSGYDRGYGIAVDGSGNAYVTGSTESSDFPTQNPYQGATAGAYYGDVFITKLSTQGNTLSYSTYLGGSRADTGSGIAVDGSGNAYIIGDTHSSDFPTQNPYQETISGDSDVFISKLSASGSVLTYSTYLGGSNYDLGYGIAVDSSGNAYVTGYTQSHNFPTQNPYQENFGGGPLDAFISKLSASGSALTYSTFLGGNEVDYIWGIAVDGSGNAYVTGWTKSSDFATQNPYQKTISGYCDAFVTKLSASGNTLLYSTYLGGSNWDYGYAIAVDGSGNAYVTGHTQSGNFPTQNPYQGTYGGFVDAFITKLSASGNTLLYSTYLGGSGDDRGRGITVGSSGMAYITGYTYSSDFPTHNPYQVSFGGENDVFITKLSASGSDLTYSTYLGGSNNDYGSGIAVDSSGNAYVTGSTASTDFPTQNPFQGTNASGLDVFVTKFSDTTSDYPYPNECTAFIPECLDPWGFYYRQCTSFVAYRMNRDGGANSFTNNMGGCHWGDADNWDENALCLGLTVNHDPVRGAIAHWNANEIGTGGHVAYVEKVDNDGSVTISEYNVSPYEYSERKLINDKLPPRYIHINTAQRICYVDPSGVCGGNTPCHTTIQTGINASNSGSVLNVVSGTYNEIFVLNESKTLTLKGGWNSSFTTQTSNTTFIKAPKANQGSLTLQELTIQP